MHSVIVHGHFYQPPREDPWLEIVETEPSAAPAHDWNERIERECYARVAGTRLLDAQGRLTKVVNLFASLSFNVGPTLFEWMEQASPDTYAAILAADRASVARHGHGNAIAMPYHHVILPLASRRDKVTEVRWGVADFRRRFGREPEGMWLPETAVDEETLDVLAAEGIRFTILAPYQVEHAPAHGRPALWKAGGGRSIALFPYDGGLAGDVAFGGLLRDANALAARLAPSTSHDAHDAADAPVAAATLDTLTSFATDGETFGHHHRLGEVTLARALGMLVARDDVRVENYGSYLERNPPRETTALRAPSSWSCAHGVERWRSDCGCRIDWNVNTSQEWRAPLRAGLNDLATSLHEIYEREGAELFSDPWAARDGYGTVVALDGAPLEAYAQGTLSAAVRARMGAGAPALIDRARELLEMERAAMRMFTSCAWFFDDLARIETVQVLRYAALALQLSGDTERLGERFLDFLEQALSNDPAEGTGRDIFEQSVWPSVPAPMRVAAGAAAAHALAGGASIARVGAFDVSVAPGNNGAASSYDAVTSNRRTGRTSHTLAQVQRAQDGRPRVVTQSAADAAGGSVVLSPESFPEYAALLVLVPLSLEQAP